MARQDLQVAGSLIVLGEAYQATSAYLVTKVRLYSDQLQCQW